MRGGMKFMQQETLKNLRINAGKSIAEVAETLGVSRQAISNYESGIRCIDIRQTLLLSSLFDSTAEEVIKAQLNSCRFALSDSPMKH